MHAAHPASIAAACNKLLGENLLVPCYNLLVCTTGEDAHSKGSHGLQTDILVVCRFNKSESASISPCELACVCCESVTAVQHDQQVAQSQTNSRDR